MWLLIKKEYSGHFGEHPDSCKFYYGYGFPMTCMGDEQFFTKSGESLETFKRIFFKYSWVFLLHVTIKQNYIISVERVFLSNTMFNLLNS